MCSLFTTKKETGFLKSIMTPILSQVFIRKEYSSHLRLVGQQKYLRKLICSSINDSQLIFVETPIVNLKFVCKWNFFNKNFLHI